MEYCIHCMAPLNGSAKFCPACGKPQAYECPENHLRPGTLLGGRYLVGAAIGAGGFGITYIARDTRLGNVVAVKEYYPNGLVNRSTTLTTNVSVGSQQRGTFEKGKQKFLAEAQLLATLNDEPGVVDVRDFFEENNTAYIVMEYLRGETLKDHLKTVQRIEYSEAFRLLLPVMRSLRAVHAMGLIHRDISPDNIMLAQNGVKLLDFGAAREVIDEDKSLSIILKRGFAPVEQYTKRNQGPWTDVYALCATMYKCITGAVPTDALLRREEPLKAPSSFGVPMTPAFESVLLRGLAVDAKDRYQSMDALIGAFETALRYPNQAVMGVTERLTPAPDDAVTQGRSVPGNPVAPPTVAAAPQTQTTPLQPVAPWQPPVTPGRPDAVTVASPQSGAQPAVPTKKKNRALAPILVGVVLLVAAVAAICVWYFGSKGKDDATDVSTDAVQVAEDSGWSDVSDSVTVPDGLGRLDTPLTKYAYSTDSQSQPYVQLRSGPSSDYDVVLTISNQALDDSNLEKAKLTVYSESVHDDAQDIDRVLCRYTYGGKDVWGWARTDFLHESKDAAEAALEAANTSKDTTAEATFVPSMTNTGTEKTVHLNTAAGSGDDLNVRAAPISDATIIGTVKNGSTVRVLAEQDDWSFIEYGTLQGWCMTSVARFDYVEPTTEATDPLPTMLPSGEMESFIMTHNAKDDENLCNFFAHFLWYYNICDDNGNVIRGYDYDCTTNDAFMMAVDSMILAPYYPLIEGLNETCGYNWDKYYTVYSWDPDYKIPADPRDKYLYDGEYAYSTYEADFFDDLLFGIFNVQPNRSFEYSNDEYRWVSLYYDSGYYYASYSDGGDGAGPDVQVSDFTSLGDGKYSVLIDFDESLPDGGSNDIATIRATVALKEIRGERVWSLYEMHEID